jgi:hypothetical protein
VWPSRPSRRRWMPTESMSRKISVTDPGRPCSRRAPPPFGADPAPRALRASPPKAPQLRCSVLVSPSGRRLASRSTSLSPLQMIRPEPPPVVSQLVRAAVGHTDRADGFRLTSGRVQWSGVSPCGSPGAVCAPQAFRTPRVRVNSMSSSPAPFATGLATGVPDMEVCVKVALRHADRFNSSRCIGLRAAMSSTSLNCARDPVTSLAARVTPIESRWRKQQSHLPRFCSLSARTSTCTLRPER